MARDRAIPPTEKNSQPVTVIDTLVAIMARLRDPETGCPWDRKQNFVTIAPYTIEEAYEVADAIERGDMADLRDELGDLLLQVVFHARMAQEAGHFSLPDVISSICDKMVRRHPHIFDETDTGTAADESNWEDIKARERSDSGHESMLDGVALALPALMRAEKIQRRAARTGFDWPDASGAYAKLDEEIGELKSARNSCDQEEEAGDLLFAAVNVVRQLGIDPEVALRAANDKFERRFRHMEVKAAGGFAALDLDTKEELWHAAKAALAKAKT